MFCLTMKCDEGGSELRRPRNTIKASCMMLKHGFLKVSATTVVLQERTISVVESILTNQHIQNRIRTVPRCEQLPYTLVFHTSRSTAISESMPGCIRDL